MPNSEMFLNFVEVKLSRKKIQRRENILLLLVVKNLLIIIMNIIASVKQLLLLAQEHMQVLYPGGLHQFSYPMLFLFIPRAVTYYRNMFTITW